MSKITDRLLPEDFKRSINEKVFSEWKRSVNEHERAGMILMLLSVAGILAMWALSGLVGLGLFFVLCIIGIVQIVPKLSARKKYQRQLGITNSELQKAMVAAKKRENSNSKKLKS